VIQNTYKIGYHTGLHIYNSQPTGTVMMQFGRLKAMSITVVPTTPPVQ